MARGPTSPGESTHPAGSGSRHSGRALVRPTDSHPARPVRNELLSAQKADRLASRGLSEAVVSAILDTARRHTDYGYRSVAAALR